MKAICSRGRAFRRALSVVVVLVSFVAVWPTKSSSIQAVYRQSADGARALCGTPLYNDPEYLSSKVTYHETQRVFSAVGMPMNVAPSIKSSETDLDRSISKIGSSISLSSKMNSPSPASVQRHVMCKDVDKTTSPWSPINPTTTFLPTNPAAILLMTVTVDSEIRTEWYYRNGDLDDAWDLYLEKTQPVGSPGTYYYYVGINLAYPGLPSYPRGWLIDTYLDGIYYFSEFFEITPNGWETLTCEGVDGVGEPYGEKDTFTIGVDPDVCYYLTLSRVAYYNNITDHCHDWKIVWYRPDDTVYDTWGPGGWSDYKDVDPTYDEWTGVTSYGYMSLDSSTPTGQWRIEAYIDTYYDGGEEWYLRSTITFTVQSGPFEVFYYYEYDQLTETSTQRTVDASYHGQTSDGNFEIYYDAADPHIDATYLSNVADAAVNSWSELVPFLGSPHDEDGDGLIEVLIVDLNAYDENIFGGILGYVQYGDENGLGMIYLDSDLDLWTSWNSLDQAFSHEFTHRIEFSYDPFEQRWIMEGMAQFGGDYAWPFCAYQTYVNTFQSNPDVQLTGDTYGSYYCAGYVFFEYVAEAFGTSAVKTILDNTAVHDGITAVENALEVSFDILFNEFSMKNYANDYGGTATTFEGIDVWAVPIASHTVPPRASGSDATNLWATDYVKFTSVDEPMVQVSFSGDAGRAHHVKVIKVVGDFDSYSVDDILLTDNQGSIMISDANTYSQIALMATRHDDSYPDASWSYGAETIEELATRTSVEALPDLVSLFDNTTVLMTLNDSNDNPLHDQTLGFLTQIFYLNQTSTTLPITYFQTNSSGQASIEFEVLPGVAAINFEAFFNGAPGYLPSSDLKTVFTVCKIYDAHIDVSLPDLVLPLSSTLDLTAQLLREDNMPLAGRMLKFQSPLEEEVFFINGTGAKVREIDVVTDENGVATVTLTADSLPQTFIYGVPVAITYFGEPIYYQDIMAGIVKARLIRVGVLVVP